VYWDALGGLFIEQVAQAAKTYIRYHKFFPKPADILLLAKETEQTHPPSRQTLPAPPRKWLSVVNSLFLQYLVKRRIRDGEQRDIDILARRAACLDLAEFFDALETENDPAATPAEMATRFDMLMRRIPDQVARAA